MSLQIQFYFGGQVYASIYMKHVVLFLIYLWNSEQDCLFSSALARIQEIETGEKEHTNRL